jgi:hypothetical protein
MNRLVQSLLFIGDASQLKRAFKSKKQARQQAVQSTRLVWIVINAMWKTEGETFEDDVQYLGT